MQKVTLYKTSGVTRVLLLLTWCILIFSRTGTLALQRRFTRSFSGNVDGFVTQTDSANNFAIGGTHIIITSQTKCRKVTGNATSSSGKSVSCNDIDIVPGSHVLVTPAKHEDNGFISAAEISLHITPQTAGQVFQSHPPPLQLSQIARVPSLAIEGVGLIEESANSQHGNGRDAKIVWINGFPLTFDNHTRASRYHGVPSIRYKLGWGGARGASIEVYAKPHGAKGAPASDMGQIKSNEWIAYRTVPQAHEEHSATLVRSWVNREDKGEEEFLSHIDPVVSKPVFSTGENGSIQFKGGTRIDILADEKLQEWVAKTGETLIPECQRRLPSGSRNKINFRFYVVRTFRNNGRDYLVGTGSELPRLGRFSFAYDIPEGDMKVNEIIAMPDGLVLLPDEMLTRLSTTAQLSALLSYAITSIVQKQAYIAWPLVTSPAARHQFLFNKHLSYGLFAFGAWQKLQMLTIGIRQMYLAGYDIREAPFAWAVAQGKPVNNPVIDSKHPDKEIPWYAAYAFNYISQYYQDVDYSKLKRGRAEYQQFLQELRKADPAAFAPDRAQTGKPHN